MAENVERPVVEFRDVVKRFDGVAVLDGVSFSVKKGEIFCIAGPSGTGKSVTLKHIPRLLTPTSGQVFVDGTDIASCGSRALRAARARIGYLFQSCALLAWMTVEENVALPLKECTRFPDDEISRRVAAALEAVGLADAADRHPAEISGGMQKRAALARAIVRDSDILLYDEPTSGLDPVTSANIHHLIARVNASLGATSIVVTHDLKSALSFADRILLLKGGRAVECLEPAAFAASRNPDVREFLAAMEGGFRGL